VPVEPTPETLTQIKSNANLKLISIPDFGFTYIGVNLRDSPYDNLKFREAMLYGFDREKALKETLQGYGELLSAGLFSSAYAKLGWQNTRIPSYEYDPGKAAQILDGAGYTMTKSGFRLDPTTKAPMSTMFIYSRLGNPAEVAIADAFARDMRAIGLPVIHLAQPPLDFEVIVQTYNFELIVLSEKAGSAPTWLYELFSSATDTSPVPLGTNLVGYHDEDFDSCAEQAKTSVDQEEARNAALQCQELLARDLPVLPVFSASLLLASRSTLREITPIVGNIPGTIREFAINIEVDDGFGGELRVGVGSDFGNLDPASTSKSTDWMILNLIAEPLLNLDTNGKLSAGLADQWSASQDGKSITFRIRTNLEFQTGKTLNADDLVATIKWLTANAKSSSPLYNALSSIENVEKVDDTSVRISLKQANAFAANSLSQLFAVPAERVAQATPSSNFLLDNMLVSSGPFVLADFRPLERVTLLYNDKFHDAPPEHRAAVDKIEATQGELLFGVRVTGGTEITVETNPLTYNGRPVEDANFTVLVYDETGNEAMRIIGTHKGEGVYQAKFSADDPALSLGEYTIQTQLYSPSPEQPVLVLEQKDLSIKAAAPLVLGGLVAAIVIVALVAVLLVRRRKRL